MQSFTRFLFASLYEDKKIPTKGGKTQPKKLIPQPNIQVECPAEFLNFLPNNTSFMQ